MQIPPEVRIKGVEMTPHLDELIAKGLTRLEKKCDYLIGVRVALEQTQARQQTGNQHRMRIDMTIPERSEIVVKRFSRDAKKWGAEGMKEEPLEALVRRTFDSAERELEKIMDKQRGQVKKQAQSDSLAVVEKIFRDKDYGFLRTLDGDEVYFHKNSLLHGHWDNLKVGTAVRYAPEIGEKGIQASTVEPVERPGAAEMHDQLHDLPKVNSAKR